MRMSGTFQLHPLHYCRYPLLVLLGCATVMALPAEAVPHHKHRSHASHSDSQTSHSIKKATKSRHAVEKHRALHKKKSSLKHIGAGAAVAAGAATAGAIVTQTPAAPANVVGNDTLNKGTNTGLPLPRFAALRADKVYMRRGPGDRYPIDWVYHRRGLPVEIEREFDVWRLVEDSDGQKGWVHQATLYGSRTFVIPGLPPTGAKAQVGEESAKEGDHIGRADARILGSVSTQEGARAHKSDILLMSHPEEDSSVVAILQPGTVGNIKLCPQNSQWCQVAVKGYQGWLPRRLFWGLLPGETIQPN